MPKIVFFLEGLSEKKMLQGLLPRILGNSAVWQLITFNGKSDLEKNLLIKLRQWQEPDTHFIILRDQDQENCIELKQRLCGICTESCKENWTVRIACHELENWFLGDLDAIETAFNIHGFAEKYRNKSKYRNIDTISNASDELSKIIPGGYFKVTGAEAIGHYLHETGNRSNSFRIFVASIENIAGV